MCSNHVKIEADETGNRHLAYAGKLATRFACVALAFLLYLGSYMFFRTSGNIELESSGLDCNGYSVYVEVATGGEYNRSLSNLVEWTYLPCWHLEVRLRIMCGIKTRHFDYTEDGTRVITH